MCFSCRSEKWSPWFLIGTHIFDFSSETAERNSMKLDRKQELNALYQFCALGRSEKSDGRPDLRSAVTFSISPMQPLNRIQRNLTGRKTLTSSTNFVFFGPIGKTRRPSCPICESIKVAHCTQVPDMTTVILTVTTIALRAMVQER